MWLWEPDGCSGKSRFAKYLAVHKGALFVAGKANDVKNQLVDKTELELQKLRLICLLLERNEEVDYNDLEAIKDGIFANGKYAGGMCVYNSPHILVMGYHAPDLYALSADRWWVRKIVNKQLVEEY
jgi:hypothetical protein